jgi:hypothetical protein
MTILRNGIKSIRKHYGYWVAARWSRCYFGRYSPVRERPAQFYEFKTQIFARSCHYNKRKKPGRRRK